MESRYHPHNRKWISARGIAALMIGTVAVCLLVAQKVATSAKNTGALTENERLDQFHKVISPILQKRCYDCHGDAPIRLTSPSMP